MTHAPAPRPAIYPSPSIWSTTIGYRVVGIGRDFCEIELDADDRHTNALGVLHGGVVMAMLDDVGGLSGRIREPGEAERRVATVDFQTQFIQPVAKGLVRVIGRIVGGGKSIYFVRGELYGNGDVLCAASTSTHRWRSAESFHREGKSPTP